MLDLRLFFDPKALNEPVAPWLRLPLAVVVAAGFGLCLGIALDTVHHWADQPPSSWHFSPPWVLAPLCSPSGCFAVTRSSHLFKDRLDLSLSAFSACSCSCSVGLLCL